MASNTRAKSELRQLAELITAQVDIIEDVYEAHNKSLPSLDEPSDEPLLEDPDFHQSAYIAMAAASRLIASLKNPYVAVHEADSAMYASALLNVVTEASITEALKEAGPKGMHISDLAAKTGIDSDKLGRGMRYLCGVRYIYREISPDVFTNNRLSITLDTKLPFDTVKDRGPHRWDMAEGSAALNSLVSDIYLKGAITIPDILLNPETTSGPDPRDAPIVYSHGFDGDFWSWIEQPGNEKHLHRFGASFRTFGKFFPPKSIVTGYDWASLPAGSLVVDVGGGLGGSTMYIAQAFPHLRYVIQDRPAVKADGEKFWTKSYPEAVTSGMVQFQGHDFFAPQPIKNASIFLMRYVLHNWNDARAKQILVQLRDAATPDTKLVVLEEIVPYTCPVKDDTVNSAHIKLPPVLKGNPGTASEFIYMLDMHQFNSFNSKDRTAGQWIQVLQEGGWKVVSVRPGNPKSIVCVPI